MLRHIQRRFLTLSLDRGVARTLLVRKPEIQPFLCSVVNRRLFDHSIVFVFYNCGVVNIFTVVCVDLTLFDRNIWLAGIGIDRRRLVTSTPGICTRPPLEQRWFFRGLLLLSLSDRRNVRPTLIKLATGVALISLQEWASVPLIGLFRHLRISFHLIVLICFLSDVLIAFLLLGFW